MSVTFIFISIAVNFEIFQFFSHNFFYIAAQTAQIVTANGAVLGSATIPATATAIPASEVNVNLNASTSNGDSLNNGQPATKTRLRRVACTCPNCRDGDRSRGK